MSNRRVKLGGPAAGIALAVAAVILLSQWLVNRYQDYSANQAVIKVTKLQPKKKVQPPTPQQPETTESAVEGENLEPAPAQKPAPAAAVLQKVE